VRERLFNTPPANAWGLVRSICFLLGGAFYFCKLIPRMINCAEYNVAGIEMTQICFIIKQNPAYFYQILFLVYQVIQMNEKQIYARIGVINSTFTYFFHMFFSNKK